MTDIERVTERLQLQKQIILFIDDNIEILRDAFEELSCDSNDLETNFYDPHETFSLDGQTIRNIRLIIVDQFFHKHSVKQKVSGILEALRFQNPEAIIIETSYAPTKEFSFDGTVGLLDTGELADPNRQKHFKTAYEFIEKIKWEANYAFKEARKVEKTDENDDQFLETFNELIENFDRLTKDPNFQKLLDLVTATEDDFTIAFMTDNDIVRRKNFLHLSWQIVGHLIYNHDENYLAMPSQRLKDLVEMALNS